MTNLEDALREIVRTVVRDVVREELRTALDELRGISVPLAARTALQYLSARQAAEVTGVHPKTIRGWTQSNQLPSYRVGRLTRVRLDELQRFMEQNQRAERMFDVDKAVHDLLARVANQDQTRCERCAHVAKVHHGGGGCRARSCECAAYIAP